ncbi:MAG: OsmC family protein [Pseudomonadota bacterium]
MGDDASCLGGETGRIAETMAVHVATVSWKRSTEGFTYDEYHREHEWRFDDGSHIKATAAPEFLGGESGVDPEEAFVASVSSCHMLSFLAICARKRIIVDHYTDEATGVMTENASGRLWVSRVDLRPVVKFAGDPPEREVHEALHHKAHEICFIANSVATEIVTHID